MRPLLVVLATALPTSSTFAVPDPADPVLAAHEAYRGRDLAALEKLANRADNLPLGDYIQFWWIEARLGTALRLVTPAEVRLFLARGEGPLSEHLRADWLKAVAQQQDWNELLADAGDYSGNDPEVLCGLATARQHSGQDELPESLRTLWLSGSATPPGCEPVFARLQAAGRLSGEDIMTRYQRALQFDRPGLARSIAPLLPADQAVPDSAFVRLAVDPSAWLEHLSSHPHNRGWRLLELQVLTRIARSDPPGARGIWERAAAGLSPAERAQGWERIGVQAAQKLDPAAIADFRKAREAGFEDSDAEWWVRAALRAGAWDEVLRATDQMSEATAARPVWRYWRARALKAGGHREEAAQLFAQVGHPDGYYGQLAAEELGQKVQLTGSGHSDPDEQAQVRARPGVQRALALFHLGLQSEAAAEWAYALKGSSERQWLAAADVARDAGWYDRMISAAERAGPDVDVTMRYPLPFRETVHQRARENGLDESWVYGLVRQESRFLPDAVSHSGAQGLMQLMPATARWVARRIGLQDFKPVRSQEVQTNVQLGSYYLHHVLENLGNAVLATAGYNAGPNRVRRWLEARGLDGTVFAETIPLAETRDYVQHVMANASLYAQRLGLPARGLKARMGTIRGLAGLPASGGVEVDGSFDIPLPAGVQAAAPASPALAGTASAASVGGLKPATELANPPPAAEPAPVPAPAAAAPDRDSEPMIPGEP